MISRSVENFFHLQFSVIWMGSRSTVILCTALSLISAFRVIRHITKRKKSIPKVCHGKTTTATLQGASKAGAVGTVGTVLAVPLFSRLAISRRGLYSQGGVAPTWWHLIDECSACMKLEKRIRQTAGEESEEVPGQQKVSSWPF